MHREVRRSGTILSPIRRLLPGATTPWAWLLDVFAAGLWVGTAILLAFVVARVWRPDTNLVLIWANAYTFWIYLPAYAVAGFAAVSRRWYLAGAASAVAAFHLAWVLPDYAPAEDIPAEAREAPSIRLMTANVYFGNDDFSSIAAEIASVDADVVFLQEFGAELEDDLRAQAMEERYPYREIAYENPFFGIATYSRLPFVHVETFDAGGRPVVVTTVDVGGKPVRLYNVHATSPGIGETLAENWNDGWRTVTNAVENDPLPLVLAGDFNMNQHHRWYGKLKQDDLDSCHEERGRGNATTWPQGRKLRPIRIDHVFHSPEVFCLSVREGDGHGSDHKPVIAELSVP